MMEAAHRRSVQERLAKLREMIIQSAGSRQFVEIAKGLARGVGMRQLDTLKAIYDFTVKAIQYTADPDGVDIFLTAETAIGRGVGDCAAQTVVVGVLARSLGMPVMLRAAKMRGPRYTHVYPLVSIGGQWVVADVTYGKGVGVEVPNSGVMDAVV